MFALYAGTWPALLENHTDERDRGHRVALYEARIASEWSTTASHRVQSRGLLDRVREAIGVAPAMADCVTCSA